ncbi:hypothetical protein BDF20DRAFT_830927 [Mycotypha africana]|uniref:uncharacterized protein n=1 Tax=Mycotypha africana TaxID=64632 RepID=UPI0022FFE71F|nr:uncharacterized protein BDF20DRAFT_830927 [Mycotypha africana]KAI8990829.1 hypothetical protein BDF20DRAFT_830927 [Mycotypha africana]
MKGCGHIFGYELSVSSFHFESGIQCPEKVLYNLVRKTFMPTKLLALRFYLNLNDEVRCIDAKYIHLCFSGGGTVVVKPHMDSAFFNVSEFQEQAFFFQFANTLITYHVHSLKEQGDKASNIS